MKIKTVCHRLKLREQFDAEVNELLDEGWALKETNILVLNPEKGSVLMIAQLYKNDKE